MKVSIIVVFFFVSSIIFGQTHSDYTNILVQLDQPSTDTAVVNKANKIALELENNNYYDSALLLISKNIEHSKKLKYRYGEATAVYINAAILLGKGDIENGLSYLIESRSIYESLHDINGIINCYTESEVTFFIQKKYDIALKDLDIALPLIKKINNKNKEGQNRYLAGLCYTELNELQKAEDCLRASEAIYQKGQFTFNLHECYSGLADLYYKKKDFEKAKLYYEKNYAYFLSNKEYLGLALNTYGLAKVYKQQNNRVLAKKYFIEAYQFCELSKELYKKDEYAKSLSDIYLSENDYKNAYKYLEIYHEAHDSLYSKENDKAINMLQSRLKMAKKDFENELLKKQQKSKDEVISLQSNLIYVVIGASLILLIFSLYAYIQYRNKKRLNKELVKLNEDISKLSLEIEEKNKLLENDNQRKAISIQDKEKRILDFAFFNAHELRAAVARILGLVNVFKDTECTKEDLTHIINMTETSTLELDKIVRDFGNRLIVIEEEDLNSSETGSPKLEDGS